MNILKKNDIWIADLSHTEQGIVAGTFPLGVSCVYSYAKKKLGNDFNFRLFKFPSDLNEALTEKSPKILCFSNFVWNFNLSYKFASIAKQRDPNIIIVLGGPNFPTEQNEKKDFFKKYPVVDYYVELEGELAFVDLVKKLSEYNFNTSLLKKNNEKITNTCYVYQDYLIKGSVSRINDVNIVPSPYLTGAMDQFFAHPIIPIIETTRGCPFTCAFCADGQESKNIIHRYDPERTKEELDYIAKRVKNIDELMLADLNFGMYKQDLVTAKMIEKSRQTYGYPKILNAAGGKNLPERVMEVATTVSGWTLGAAIQSTDKDVLKAIQRANISSDAYAKLINFGNKDDSTKTFTDIILGLPEDSKEKHFETIRFGIDNDVNTVRMQQAMMLVGTKMASKEDRKKYGLKTKWRTTPGCVGFYKIIDKKYPVAELDEIVVSSKTLSHEDYLNCRVMNLIVETFYNNAIFYEIFALIKSLGIPRIDLLIYIKDHTELYTSAIKEIINDFISETTEDLYDTDKEAHKKVLSPEMIDKYINQELGFNELLSSRTRLHNNHEDLTELLFTATKKLIKKNYLLKDNIEKYLIELKRFIHIQKKDQLEVSYETLESNLETIRKAEFIFDFKTISENKFQVNSETLKKLDVPIRFDFYYNKEQKKYISKQVKFYSKNVEGMGRMFYESDARIFSRSFFNSSEDKKVIELKQNSNLIV